VAAAEPNSISSFLVLAAAIVALSNRKKVHLNNILPELSALVVKVFSVSKAFADVGHLHE
jgi:hypothetical protein